MRHTQRSCFAALPTLLLVVGVVIAAPGIAQNQSPLSPLLEPGHAVMERSMLRGLRSRVEGRR